MEMKEGEEGTKIGAMIGGELKKQSVKIAFFCIRGFTTLALIALSCCFAYIVDLIVHLFTRALRALNKSVFPDWVELWSGYGVGGICSILILAAIAFFVRDLWDIFIKVEHPVDHERPTETEADQEIHAENTLETAHHSPTVEQIQPAHDASSNPKAPPLPVAPSKPRKKRERGA